MDQPAEDTGRIARSASKVSIAVMCSRLLGLVREQAFAVLFGAGFAFDAFVVAFRIPNLLRDLFGEGALSAAFVTVFSDYDETRGAEQTWRLAGNVLVFITIVLSMITLIGILFADEIVLALVDADFERIPGKVALTRVLTMIMFPFLIFISLASVVMGILNTKGRFFIPALASSFFNLGSIIGGVTLAFLLKENGQPSIIGMAIGTLIGGILQLGGQLPSLARIDFKFIPHLNLKDPGLHRILKLMAPAVFGLAALQINIFINTYFASSLQEGSLSWLNYAFRFFQFPVGVFGVAISVAALPLLSRQAATKDLDRLKETFASSLTMSFSLTIPATLGLILLADPVIRIIFEHGSFSAEDTYKTAAALRFYALGLFAYASVKVMVPVFYALDDTRYPVAGSFLAVGVNIIIILLTIAPMQHKALALSISGAMTANFLFLGIILYRKLGGYSLSYLAAGLGKVVSASILMGVYILGGIAILANWMQRGFLNELTSVFFFILSGAAVYGFVLYLLRFKEFKLVIDTMAGRIKG
ncbi:MAG: murein biosynthesis integral membrane protein MurJ [Desulfobulbales bacterium]|nr:murein biosynthesis integral membrane protein MurJ [Desulfobulbales bacterium]